MTQVRVTSGTLPPQRARVDPFFLFTRPSITFTGRSLRQVSTTRPWRAYLAQLLHTTQPLPGPALPWLDHLLRLRHPARPRQVGCQRSLSISPNSQPW
ncbi:hypothetical protein CF327_g6465 [Tilletia walkeri]|uniref:Uncharacterized protein n=1 Tax=Tilletia walkeri TaxID=117179 RepID=A0A8X7N6W7_9BASI|nr:hypothetical protein CF327_g6465 [Tilletia walkeri]KAE8266885.1 hypothetical protein A4X09_0g5466 [Tilletia walkeri]